MSSGYNEGFYSNLHDETQYSAETITSIVQDLIKPSSVVDVGCGVGTWLKVMENNGISDILGIEGMWVKDESIVISKNNFLKTDLSQPIGVNRQFDLAISMEVAEHIEEKKSDQFIKNLTDLAPVVLFSAAIPLQGGVHHVNEQWPDYWKEKFIKKDYILIDSIRPKVWNDARIKVWYIQNSFLFVKSDKIANYPALSKYKSDTAMLSVVHPRLYNFKLATWPIKKAVKNSLKRLFSKEKIRS
jgi:SAM-dependent methyltransferase